MVLIETFLGAKLLHLPANSKTPICIIEAGGVRVTSLCCSPIELLEAVSTNAHHRLF